MTKHNPTNQNIAAEYVRSLLSYNKKTGALRWKINRRPRGKKGQPAGFYRADGYLIVGIDGAMYLGHRLAWLIVTGYFPPEQIDHKSRNPRDMRWKNLRAATHGQNKHNQGVNKNNTSGIKGVTKRKDCNRWQAHLGGGPNKYIGIFKTKEEAQAAYIRAAKERWGEFAGF